MNDKTLTATLLGLDLTGSLLFVIGAVGQFGGGGTLVPEPWAFPGVNWLLMTLGIALIVPYMTHVLRKGRRREEST